MRKRSPFLFVAKAKGRPSISKTAAEDSPLATATYNGLYDRSGLFLTFSETKPEPVPVKEFIEEHGLTIEDGNFEEIADQIREMRLLVDLWKSTRAPLLYQYFEIAWGKDQKASAKVVYDSGTGPQDFWGSGGLRVKEIIASKEVDPEWLEIFEKDDPGLPALALIQRRVNRRLLGSTETQLLYDLEKKRMVLLMCRVPKRLIDAIWLQFAQAVSENKRYRQCGECHKWFEVSPKVARTHRKFCSYVCRNRSFRSRQEQARSLHQEGKTIAEIAKKVRADAATVRKWVKVKD